MRYSGAIVLRKWRGRFGAGTAHRFAFFRGFTLPRPLVGFGVTMALLDVVFPLLVILAVLALLLTGHASLAPVVGISGATTGTETGTDFSGLNQLLKNVYTEAFENNVEKESEISDLIEAAEGFTVTEGPDGNQITLDHIFSSGGGIGSMSEDDYLPTPTLPTIKQSAITIPIHSAVVQLSGKTLRRVKKGPAAFATWADKALPAKAQRLAFHLDRQRLGTGTGIICRISSNPPTGTGDGIYNMFGISGLDDRAAMLLLRDDSLRYGPNANGTSLRVGTVVVLAVHYGAKTIDTTVNGSAGTATSAALNDYVFIGDANMNSAGKEMMGLEGIIDDGTNIATFQTLTRSSFPELQSQIIDASTGNFDQTLSEELLDYSDAVAFERGNMGRPTFVLVNRSGQRSFWKNLKNDRIINDPRGSFQGGVNRARLKVQLGDRIVTLAGARKVPASRAYGVDGTAVHRYKVGAGRWDDTDGSIWNRVVDGTGRKDAFFAVYILEEQQGASNPGGCFKIINLLET